MSRLIAIIFTAVYLTALMGPVIDSFYSGFSNCVYIDNNDGRCEEYAKENHSSSHKNLLDLHKSPKHLTHHYLFKTSRAALVSVTYFFTSHLFTYSNFLSSLLTAKKLTQSSLFIKNRVLRL